MRYNYTFDFQRIINILHPLQISRIFRLEVPTLQFLFYRLSNKIFLNSWKTEVLRLGQNSSFKKPYSLCTRIEYSGVETPTSSEADFELREYDHFRDGKYVALIKACAPSVSCARSFSTLGCEERLNYFFYSSQFSIDLSFEPQIIKANLNESLYNAYFIFLCF